MTGQGRFSISKLWKDKQAAEQPVSMPAGEEQPATAAAGPSGAEGLGLEMANIAALPDADDYAAHEFYRANFSPSEIAYCVRQPAAKAAFQGLLAAKRAIIKSGAAGGSAAELSGIEIGFDAEGRPIYPGCRLSICDTGTIAAAVCLWLGGLPGQAAFVPRRTRTFPVRTRILAFLILLSLLVLFALALWKIIELARH
jgi:phosphopantetheinyl transferase (holo-ACP synthase)